MTAAEYTSEMARKKSNALADLVAVKLRLGQRAEAERRADADGGGGGGGENDENAATPGTPGTTTPGGEKKTPGTVRLFITRIPSPFAPKTCFRSRNLRLSH